MSRIERCELPTIEGDRRFADLPVVRAYELVTDCGCWKHHTQRFDLILTPSGDLYVRAATNEGFYRSLDVSGPMTVCLSTKGM